ncbi:class I SAM-dependent methyltransferase [Micromonospora echinofusca]|uniref:Methyltransferase domain-containing protein n=1 Tax=Micromonospora echinofusca TaxID=47858 RepID=A0ABS3VMY2_MICEH|nr:class I SAM-dependent methyltransferase [Micromonospora echinofusca]MBO4205900.1 methyltransferase domain-containing protein [Micromonospora echinofusca]
MAKKSVPERLSWVVDLMSVDPSDQVLEIGCGRGVAVDLVCERLTSGKITAIDRSEKAIQGAAERNSGWVADGRADLRVAAIESAEFGGQTFDKIFAVNVNLFWVRSPAKELALFQRILAPGGAVYLCWEPPGAGKAVEIDKKVSRALADHGWQSETVTGQAGDAALICLVARPS